MQEFQKFLRKLSTATKHEELCEAVNEFTEGTHIEAFAYLGVSSTVQRNSEPVLVSTYPKAWTDMYLKRQFEIIDPVINEAGRSHIPFFWGAEGDVTPKNIEEERLFREADGFGIRHGWTVPVHDSRGRIATLNYCCSKNFNEFRRQIEDSMTYYHIAGIHLHAAISRNERFFWNSSIPSLSRREVECLEWSAKGKSRADIAVIIGIRPRTVKFHLENAMRKLNVNTTRQAILRATVCGIIAP